MDIRSFDSGGHEIMAILKMVDMGDRPLPILDEPHLGIDHFPVILHLRLRENFYLWLPRQLGKDAIALTRHRKHRVSILPDIVVVSVLGNRRIHRAKVSISSQR